MKCECGSERFYRRETWRSKIEGTIEDEDGGFFSADSEELETQVGADDTAKCCVCRKEYPVK